MAHKDLSDLTIRQRQAIPKQVNLGPLPGMPVVEDQSEPTRSAILFACPELDELPNQGMPMDDTQIRALLNRLIAEIDSGAALEARVMNLAVREGDWSKLSKGQKKQPQLPLKVGIRGVRD